MASLPLGRQMLLLGGDSYRSSRCRLHEACRECGCVRPLLRSGSSPRSISSKTNAEQQSRAYSSYLNPLGMRLQLICAASIPRATRFCSSRVRSTSALALLCNTHAVPLTEARRRVFAEASVSQDAYTSAFAGPSTSSSALSCRLTLSLALRGPCDTLSSSSYSLQQCQPASFGPSCLRPNVASAFPRAASGTSGLPYRRGAHEAAAPLQKAVKHHLCSMIAVAGENLHEKCVFGWRTYVSDKRSAISLRHTLQLGSPSRVVRESSSDSAQQKWVWPRASAVEVHSHTPATASRLGPYLPLSAIAMAPLSAGMTTTVTPTGRSTTAAARFSAQEICSAGAPVLCTTIPMRPDCPNNRGSAGWEAARQRLCCSDRKKQKEFRGMASDAKKRFFFSVVYTGEAGSEERIRCAASRGSRCRRPVSQTDSGGTSPEGRRSGRDPGCSAGTDETKGTCISDFGGLKCISLALGVAPLQQKEQSLSGKAVSGSVQGGCEDFSFAAPQNAETDTPLCTTAAEVPLSEGNLLSVHAPDEGSYAAVLHQKIRAESAGWVADSDLVNCLTDFLLLFKTAVDLPWALALPLLGAAVRLTTLPFAVSSERDIRLRAVYHEEMTALQRAAEKAKTSGFGSPEFKKAQKRLNTFLKKHNLSLIPLSIFQVLLVGLVVSLTTPAIRKSDYEFEHGKYFVHFWTAAVEYVAEINISGRSDEFPHFAVEHPAWVESLALPDSTPLTAFIGTYGMLSLIMAGWLVSDKIAKTLPQHRPSGPPFITRLIPGIIASCVTVYAGVYFPVGAMFMLLPAAGVQAVFTRMFRMRAVERIFSKIPEDLMPESVKPLHAVYAEALRLRAPEVFQMWQRESQKKNSTPRDVHSQVLLLWRKKWQQDSWSASRPTPYFVASNGARL